MGFIWRIAKRDIANGCKVTGELSYLCMDEGVLVNRLGMELEGEKTAEHKLE